MGRFAEILKESQRTRKPSRFSNVLANTTQLSPLAQTAGMPGMPAGMTGPVATRQAPITEKPQRRGGGAGGSWEYDPGLAAAAKWEGAYYQNYQNMEPWERRLSILRDDVTPFRGIRAFLSRRGLHAGEILSGQEFAGMYAGQRQALDRVKSESALGERVLYQAAQIPEIAGEFILLGGGIDKALTLFGPAAISKTGAILERMGKSGLTLGLRELLQAPTAEEEKMLVGDVISGRAGQTGIATAVGAGFGLAGGVMPKAAARIPTIMAGFGALTYGRAYKQTGSHKAAADATIESLATYLGFELMGLGQQAARYGKMKLRGYKAGKKIAMADAVKRTEIDMIIMRQKALKELGLRPDATSEQITKAYRAKVKETHPDIAVDKEAKAKRVIQAAEFLRGKAAKFEPSRTEKPPTVTPVGPGAKKAKPSPKPEKQPWEMTKEEHRIGMMEERTKHKIPAFADAAKKALPAYKAAETKKEVEHAWVDEFRRADKNHSNQIKIALAKNKPVPRAVLEEYKGEKWADEALAKLTAKKRGQAGFVALPETEKVAKTVNKIQRFFLQTMQLQPAKITEKRHGKDVAAAVIRAIHEPDLGRVKFEEHQLDTTGKQIAQLESTLSKYPDSVLEDLMLTRGHGLSPEARKLQIGAFVRLPKELKTKEMRRAINEIADFNYSYLQAVAGEDINKVKDYFYGIYKGPTGKIDNFLKYYMSTEKYKKQKVFPNYAEAKAWGLEIKNPNPIHNLLAEYQAIAYRHGLEWLKGELLRTGEGRYIAEEGLAPADWKVIGKGMIPEPVFSGFRVEPDLAALIENLIATNKISMSPTASFFRSINNFVRSVKFIGSMFHMLSIGKQSIIDTPYVQFGLRKTSYKGITPGFRKNDLIFQTPFYRRYVANGGGHRYSVEWQARKTVMNLANKFNKTSQVALKAAGLPVRIPIGFVDWMFDSYIPKVKYAKTLDVYNRETKRLGRELTDAELQKIIKEGQNFYGMMNERLFGRSGTATSILRFFFMAPGYAEGNFRTILKSGLQWRGDAKANRSRANIINSLLFTGILGTIGTAIMTNSWPEEPEDVNDLRDLFKVDTGFKDQYDNRIMIDLLTYDRDYWDVYFNLFTLRPGEVLSDTVRRLGGMKSATLQVLADFYQIMEGKAIVDWKNDKIYHLTDPFLQKVIKTAKHEIQRLTPIAGSVYKRAREKDIDRALAAVTALLGLRITKSEKAKHETKILVDCWDMRDKREQLGYYIAKLDDPWTAIKRYNDTLDDILKSDFVQKRAPHLYEKYKSLYIDPESVVTWKRFPPEKLDSEQLIKALRANTYKRDQKLYRRDISRWRPHKNHENQVEKLRAEILKRQISPILSRKSRASQRKRKRYIQY